MLKRIKELAYDTVTEKFIARDPSGKKITVPLGDLPPGIGDRLSFSLSSTGVAGNRTFAIAEGTRVGLDGLVISGGRLLAQEDMLLTVSAQAFAQDSAFTGKFGLRVSFDDDNNATPSVGGSARCDGVGSDYVFCSAATSWMLEEGQYIGILSFHDAGSSVNLLGSGSVVRIG